MYVQVNGWYNSLEKIYVSSQKGIQMPEEKKSYYTEASRKSHIEYAKRSLKRIPLDVQKEEYEEIRAAADAAGMSVNGFIKTAIREKMGK